MTIKDKGILYIDCENSRMVLEFPSYVLYDIKRVDPKYIKHDWHITCAAWAWLDPETKKMSKIETVAVNDFKTRFKKDHRDDYMVVKKLHEVLSEAKLVVGHNSSRFDVKKLNYKFIKYGFEPLHDFQQADTLKIAKKEMNASSNSLSHLARELNVPTKIDLPSSVMWAADDGCEKSLKKLVRYNKGDIKAGANLYFKLLPYATSHPNLNSLLDTDKMVCPKCGSKKITGNGTRVTKTGKYKRYRCNGCGSSFRGKKSIKTYEGR